MKLMIGTVQFGLDYGISNADGKTDSNEVFRILKLATEHGIDMLDTARSYGASEYVLGEVVEKLDTDISFVTKTLSFPHIIAEDIIPDLKTSLSNLGVESVHGLLAHRSIDLTEGNGKETFEQLSLAKSMGLAKKIGVTVYSPKETMDVINMFPIDLVQLPCSILDQRFVRSGTIEELSRRGIEVHARSIFLQGLLFMEPEGLSSYFDEIKPCLINMHNIATSNDIPIVKLALEYIKSISGIDKIVVGVNNIGHMRDILKAYISTFECDVDFEQFAIDDEKFVNPSKWDSTRRGYVER